MLPSLQRVSRNGGSAPMSLQLALARQAAQRAAEEAVGAGLRRYRSAGRWRRRSRPRRHRCGPSKRTSRRGDDIARRHVGSADVRGLPKATAASESKTRQRRADQRRRGAGRRDAVGRLGHVRAHGFLPLCRDDQTRRPAARMSSSRWTAAGVPAPARRHSETTARARIAATCAASGTQRSIGSGLAQPPGPRMRPQHAGRRCGRLPASASGMSPVPSARPCRRARRDAGERHVERHRQRDADAHHDAPAGDRVERGARRSARRCRPAGRGTPAASTSDHRRRASGETAARVATDGRGHRQTSKTREIERDLADVERVAREGAPVRRALPEQPFPLAGAAPAGR